MPRLTNICLLAATLLSLAAATTTIEGGTSAVVQVTQDGVTREVRIIAAILASNCSDFDTHSVQYEENPELTFNATSQCWCWNAPLAFGGFPSKLDGSCDSVCPNQPETCSANGEAVVATGMHRCDNGYCVADPSQCADVVEQAYGQNQAGVWYRTSARCVPVTPSAPAPPPCQATCSQLQAAFTTGGCCDDMHTTPLALAA